MATEIADAIVEHQAAFGMALSTESIERLAVYYDLVIKHNPLLHLVAPCSTEEFATRHILESLTLHEYLSRGAAFADIGPGAGLPSIPCLIVRDDLKAVLIESKAKKADFLTGCVADLGLDGRTTVINRQFAETDPGSASFVTCRALDKYVHHLPRLIRWAGKRPMLLFGGDALADGLSRSGIEFRSQLMPLSERRYLFICEPLTVNGSM